MSKPSQSFDPHEILMEHKKFFEDHRAAFSPLPKRILTPTESENKIASLHPLDQGNYYSVMPKQNNTTSTEHQNSSVESPEGKDKELLIMTIEIGDGNKDTLRVFEHDDPYELAKKFCEVHELNLKIVEPLAQNIYANMEKVLEERAEALEEDKEEQAPAKENEFESFKDIAVRTGEFKSFSEVGQENKQINPHSLPYQQQQRQQEQQEQQIQQQIQQLHHYYQQQQRQQDQEQQKYQHLPLQKSQKPQANNSVNLNGNNGSDYMKGESQRDTIKETEHEKSISHPDRTSEIAQTPWESPEKQLLAQRGFHMRASFDGKVQKSRNSQNTTNVYEGTTHEDLSRHQTSKPVDTTHRRSFFDYPSDPRLHNASYIPESFQNEDEYIEYLITSQYGGGQKNEIKKPDYTFTPNINRSSKMMLENKFQNSRLNVYDRLHNHAKNKVQNQRNTSQTDISPRRSTGASRKSTRQNSSDNNRGAGAGLYYRGMKRKEEVKRMLEDFKHERTLEEDRSCTFKPYINPISSEIVNSKPKYERPEETLINYGRATQEKLERARSIQKEREVEGCTFQPMINSISAKLVYEREEMSQDAPKDRFTKLFHDHKVRQAQQEIRSKALSAQEGCTFSPMINSRSESIVDRTNLADRARKFENKVNKLENLRREREEMDLFDVETGQPLFRPSIGRPPKEPKRERKQSIGDYLYNQRFEKENLRKSLCEQEKKQRESQIIRTSEKSQIIMENIQRNKLQAIFSLLDSDEDGYISSSKIDIGSLGTHVLEAFAPLLCEMEELDQTLSLQDFIEAAEKLLKTLPVHERDMIIMAEKFERRTTQPTIFSFHPDINKKSAKLAQGQRPYGNFEALYDHYMGEQKTKEEKLKHEQEKRKQEELKDCSFKPTLGPESNMPIISMNNYNYYYVDHLI